MIKKQIKMFKRDIDVTYSTQCHMYIHTYIYIYINGSKNIDRNRPTRIGLIKTRPGKLYIYAYISILSTCIAIYITRKTGENGGICKLHMWQCTQYYISIYIYIYSI